MDLNYRLTEKDVRTDLLTDNERKAFFERRDEILANKGDLQPLYWQALQRTVSRMGSAEENKSTNGVRLTAENVHSIYLTDNEKEELEKRFGQAREYINKKLSKPFFEAYHKQQDALYDRYAREAGFSQFDENDEGTGLRNYTALGKHQTPQIRKQVEQFKKSYENSPEVRKLMKSFHAFNRGIENILDEASQVYLRNMLSFTNERIIRYDSAGERILSRQQYLDKLASCSPEEQDKLKANITQPVSLSLNGVQKTVEIDRSIAPLVAEMSSMGYVTAQCCSGTLADHPNYRYVQNDEQGRFFECECIYFNKQGSGAYISFWKPETGMNSEENIEDIIQVAEQNGWLVEHSQTFGMQSVCLRLPYTYDGAAKLDVLHEANELVEKHHPGLKEADFFKWLDKRSSCLPEVEARHNGVVRWTDKMVINRWEKLVQGLSLARSQRQEAERKMLDRITDVSFFHGSDGNLRIKCSIDGVSMLSERFQDKDKYLLQDGTDVRKIAARYFEDNLKQGQEREKSLKI